MKQLFEQVLQEKILILDGAMGTALQKLGLTEEDYSGGCHCRKRA